VGYAGGRYRSEARVDLFALERRIRALEALSTRLRLVKGASSQAGQPINYDSVSLLRDLEQIARELTLMREDAQASGDHRFALACIREFCRVGELVARLRGELDGKSPTNVLHVHLDADTAKKIAETYLARWKKLENE